MLQWRSFDLGVFIGGMQGVEDEFNQFCQMHLNARVILLGSTGGATRILWEGQQDLLKTQWEKDHMVEDMRYDKGYAAFFRRCFADIYESRN